VRQPKTTSPFANASAVRLIILAALVAALILVAGQARPASAVGEAGTFSFELASVSVDEGQAVQLPALVINRSELTGVQLGLNVQLGTAETGDLGESEDFCFPVSGAISQQFNIPIGTNPDADSDAETFTVTLTEPGEGVGCASGNYIVGGQSSITVTIDDTGGGGDGDFEFANTNSTADEGDTVTLNVTRGGDLDGAASVDCVVTGGSAEGSDWDAVGDGDADFGDNDSTGSCQFEILTDGDSDASETLIVTLQNPVNGSVGSPSQHTITIGQGEEDGDFEFTTTSSQVDEGDVVVLNVHRNGDLEDPASVECNVTGGTGEGSDWDPIDDVANFGDEDDDATCQFQILADGDADLSETLIVTLQDPINGTVGSPSQHTITIGEEGDFEFTTTSSTAGEGATVTLNVLRGGDLEGSASVECNVTAGTGEGSDWDPIDTVANFGDEDSTGTCQFQILVDADADVSETLVVTLQNPVNGSIGSPSQHTITITQTSNVYTFASATYTVQESAGTITVTVNRSSNVGTGSVSWDITGGTATAGVDYIDASGTVNFTAGQTSQTFSITILVTAAVEANETILVSLEDPVNGTLGDPDDTVITITEVGVPTVTDVNPGNIPVTGGTVVITGTNFTGATQVTFGAVNAVSFVINNATQITAVAPARPAGTYDIRVTGPAGTSANTVNDNITYGAGETVTYQLAVRWSLIAWLGKDNAPIASALQGTVSLSDSQAQTAPNNIFNLVTAVATWDNPTQRYLFWFPGGGSVPGANDITQFNYGTPYWIAVTANVNWTVIEGP
jgi:hypothetical protein